MVNTVTIPSNLTISGGEDDVWIFQIACNLNMSSAVSIQVIGRRGNPKIFFGRLQEKPLWEQPPTSKVFYYQ